MIGLPGNGITKLIPIMIGNVHYCRDKHHCMGPIESAARDGDLAAVEALLDEDSDLVHSENCDGWTPLIYASINGHADVARCLLQRGSRVDAVEMGGCTALYQTAFDGHVEVAEVLLEHGADVRIRALDGMTALMQAAAAGHERLVRVLLAHGAPVDDADKGGKTALHHACTKGHAAVVCALVEGGADERRPLPSSTLPSGLAHHRQQQQQPPLLRPMDIARQRGHEEVVRALEVRRLSMHPFSSASLTRVTADRGRS
jgi:ankyrin repeat protein